jgi:hypothetical protein
MKRIVSLAAMLVLLFVAGAAVGQNTPAPENELSFQVVSEIGRAVPRSIIYDPNFERIAMIDAYNRLLLIDALTYETQHQLYENDDYHDFAFSHDGRWLALAVDKRMELYNAETGELVSKLDDPGEALSIHGPLTFSPDDNLLLFVGTHPAPQSLRRYENDTSDTPWIWNLTAARNEGQSTFPRRVEAWQFFDYRNGFVLGPDNRIVAALPGRLHIIDAYTLDVLFEIDTARYEQDPLLVWFSLRDNRIFVLPVYEDKLLQVDTQKGVLVEIPLGQDLTQTDLATVGGIELGQAGRVIGDANSEQSYPLAEVLLGGDYRYFWDFHPLTVTLIDLLTVPATGDDRLQSLLFVYDEELKKGQFVFTSPYNTQQMVLHPDGVHLLIRRTTNSGEQVEIYNIATGGYEGAIIPALRDLGGYYSRTRKNRVLAYDKTASVIVSDFQRFDAASFAVLAEDLRYSRYFDQFFFTSDNQDIVTLSNNEWRLWDLKTSEVTDRKALPLRGSVIATSPDGFRFLTQFDVNGTPGVQILDVTSGQTRTLMFQNLLGRYIEQIIPSPDWEHYFVIYSVNSYGAFSPSNEVAIYSMDDGQLWFMAGDDLPPAEGRNYGWTDDNTAYIYGEGYRSDVPSRIFGADFAVDGTPRCLLDKYPYQAADLGEVWYNATLKLRGDEVAALAKLVCQKLATQTFYHSAYSAVPPLADALLYPTATPILIPGVPACLTARYPNDANAYAQDWETMIAGLPPDQVAKMAELVCEGIGTPRPSYNYGDYNSQTMMIDVASGMRLDGSYNPPANSRPIQPIRDEFYRDFQRDMGTAILSPDENLVAVSSLPGELVVFKLVTPYRTILSWGTATAGAEYQAENRIAVLPTSTPTFNPIGTAQPTLTPTITPTPPPRPETLVDQPMNGDSQDLCPAETLFTLADPPPNFSPSGRLIGPVTGESLWAIEPEDGRRYEDPTIPNCDAGVQCTFSPDEAWILGDTVNEIYVVRPDGTDQRVLFDKTKRYPDSIWWSGRDTLEYEVYDEIPDKPGYRDYLYQRDILDFFPDPKPWWPGNIVAHGLQGELISRQPDGPLAVIRTTFSTGVDAGYLYYIYNTNTGISSYFARLTYFPTQELHVEWAPLGDKLFYYYPTPPNVSPIWYQFDPATGTHLRLGDMYPGKWSNDGRYRVFATNRRTQPVGVWDIQTGLTRTYCIPETGARLYEGAFHWSPDSRYVALQAKLPKDESQEGVGQHTLILDIESGTVTDLTSGVGDLIVWTNEPGSFGGGN